MKTPLEIGEIVKTKSRNLVLVKIEKCEIWSPDEIRYKGTIVRNDIHPQRIGQKVYMFSFHYVKLTDDEKVGLL